MNVEFRSPFLAVMKLASDQQPDIEDAETHNNLQRDANAQRQVTPFETIVLGLSTDQCFAIPRSKAEGKRLPPLKALAYEIEPKLPADAEDLCITGLAHREGCLLIAADSRQWEKTLEDLQALNTVVVGVCPLVLMAWEAISRELDPQQVCVVVVLGDMFADVFFTKGTSITHWYWADQQCEDLTWMLRGRDGDMPASILLVGNARQLQGFADGKMSASLAELFPTATTRHFEIELEQVTLDAAERIARGQSRAIVNLPISPELARVANPALQKVSRLLGASFVILLAACVVTIFARAWSYDAAAETLVQAQEEVFRETFPGQAVPVGIWRRMQSERRQLEGTHGNTAPEVLDITPLFQAWLTAMPSDARYQVDQVDLRSDQLDRLSGSAKTFADVQQVSDGLNAAGFAVKPASTGQSGGRVTLRFESLPFTPVELGLRDAERLEETSP